MALAKDRAPHDSRVGSFHGCSLYGNPLGGSPLQVSDLSSPALSGFEEFQKAVIEVGDGLEKTSGFVKNFGMSNSSPLSSPSSGNSNGYVFRASNHQPEEINFKSSAGYDNFMHTSGSLLSFEQNEQVSQKTYSKTAHNQDDEYSIWENNLNNYQKCSTNLRLLENFNSHQTASSYASLTNSVKEKQHGEEMFGWFCSEATAATDSIQETRAQEAGFYKRPHMEEDIQALKKQCTGATRKPKPKLVPAKDPQSIAAKNRRERISERLKILQELVPNGSKVDLVTMLEKAISYVKFLQLQVKVLATDEFWPVQGGKAPEISQVKEAIDAILSAQRDRNSSSK
ncbi:hypothetical protein L1049_002513 [Liquidambar formosana]|uniref:BHLH domain-containing protein n=1 Tax=Liquidambar formosana TaxID=63359 RepID=A0AAP0R6S0_LIQFO